MKKMILLFSVILFFFFSTKSYATYDPLSKPNNKFGIHILFTSEISEAANLINSTGGDWGYVTIPIQASDRNLEKWQKFMDDCKRFHVIPILRLATIGDYFSKASWSKPTDYDVLDFANFLNNLSWPTKNRYIVVFNEQNRGDEWGGTPDAKEYSEILNYAVDIFKARNEDFFILMGGLDNASANIPNQSINNYNFMYQMEQATPGIFSKIDGISSHSYPNPAFSMPPSNSNQGIYSFYYQKKLADELAEKNLPVFITETGWSSVKVSQEEQSQYYINAFLNYWDSANIIAVTPFVLNGQEGPFTQFSFVNNDKKNLIYYAFYNLKKIKGEPDLTSYEPVLDKQNSNLPEEKFKSTSSNSIFNQINTPAKKFFKWLLGI